MADDGGLKLSQQLVMTPQLQMAIKLLATTSAELPALVEKMHAEHPGALAPLEPGDPDPFDAVGELYEEDAPRVVFEPGPGWDALGADIWVFGNPPRVAANRAVLPYLKIAATDPDGLRAARWCLRALLQRALTYQRVVETIVAERPEIAISLEPERIKRVKVRDVAETVGMHESTITRVLAACRYQTVHGLHAFAANRSTLGFTKA